MADADGSRVDVDPSFLIMGTPRSGTTLMQRLVGDWTGARIPPETHFWPEHAERLWNRHTFPAQASALEIELRQWPLLTETLDELGLDVGAVIAEVDDPCERLWDLFAAIVRALAGPARLYGEKSPRNLIWWHVLARDVPHLKFIAVVRDPRAVVASATSVPFGSNSHILRAEEWRADQHLLRGAMQALPASRLLVVRYEDLVQHPDRVDERVRRFLDATSPVPKGADAEPRQIFLRREVWKANVHGDITTDRVDAWRSTLTERAAEHVAAICRSGMGIFGYEQDAPSTAVAVRHMATLSPRDQLRRVRFRARRRRRVRRSTTVRA